MAASALEESDQTIDLLEERLNRINYLINGDPHTAWPNTPSTNQPAAARLRKLELALSNLSSRHSAVAQVLDLQRQYPDIIDPAGTPSTAGLPPQALAQIVLAHNALYRQNSSQLQSLQGLSIPRTSESIQLVAQQDRIEKATQRQVDLAHEVQELRSRSAQILERWYEEGVLGMGEYWADWEERMRDVEIQVRRREALRRRDEAIS